MEQFLFDPGVIIALISLMATAFTTVAQYRKNKAESKKIDAETSETLIDMALKLSKHEVDTMRMLGEELERNYKTALERVVELERELAELQKKLDECEKVWQTKVIRLEKALKSAIDKSVP